MAATDDSTPAQLDLSFDPAEEWRDIPGYEGLYQVSNLGRVRNIRLVIKPRIPGMPRRGAGSLMPQLKRKDGYRGVHLCRDGKAKVFSIHALVLTAFVSPRPEGFVCNHLNGDPADNRVENLEWCTQKANIAQSIRAGKHPSVTGAGTAKLTAEQVREIRRMSAEGIYQASIARAFNVSKPAIWHIVHRRHYARVE